MNRGYTLSQNLSAVFILLFNVLLWYFMMLRVFSELLDTPNFAGLPTIYAWTTFYVSIIVFSIIGSVFSSKIKTLHLLNFWIVFGMLSSLLPILLDATVFANLLFMAVLLGSSFGFGMPSCLAYFADSTRIENRGRLGGILFFIVSLSAPIFGLFILITNTMINSIFLSFWRGTGLVWLLVKKQPLQVGEKQKETRKEVTFTSIFNNKPFILYFIAWFMFCCVDMFEKPILKSYLGDFFYSMQLMEAVVASFFSLIGGWLCDSVGRKRVIIYGFAALGLGYAVIGIAPELLISWYFYFIIDGVSAGIFFAVFILILWGDLSTFGAREKYYTVGGIPYFTVPLIPKFMNLFVTLPQPNVAFSLASFFLFLAVIPLLYAPETLPEKHIHRKKLKEYIEKAKKLKEKHETKQ